MGKISAATISKVMADIGRKGGLKGGPARLKATTLKQRKAWGRKGADVRWKKPNGAESI